MQVLRNVLCAMVVTGSLSPAFAADRTSDFFTAHFAKPQGGQPCYGRTYDDTHMKAHPLQRVRRIEIDMDATDANGTANTADRFELGIALMVAKSSEWYGNAAFCKASQTDAKCYIDGDGGLFTLLPAENGGLRLETGDYGIVFEGGQDVVEFSGTDGDDRVFLLKPSREECDAADAYFKVNRP